MLPHLLFQSVSQFVKSGSSPWFLLPAGPHQGVNTRRAVLWSLHAIASLHFLLHLVKSLASGTRVRDSDKEEVEFRGSLVARGFADIADRRKTSLRLELCDSRVKC